MAGFRLDVIDQVGKDPDRQITANGPRLMEFLHELNRETWGSKNLVTVGEAWGADIPRARQYSAPDGSVFSMVFQFEQMCLDHEADKWVCTAAAGTAFSGTTTTCPGSSAAGAMTASAGSIRPRRWQWPSTACRARPTSTRARSWA